MCNMDKQRVLPDHLGAPCLLLLTSHNCGMDPKRVLPVQLGSLVLCNCATLAVAAEFLALALPP